MTPQLIIFDFDGTLLDSAPDLCASLNEILKQENHPPLDYQLGRRFIGSGIRVLIERAFGYYGVSLTKAKMNALMDDYFDVYKNRMSQDSKLYPQVHETLKALIGAGYRLALCTNKVYELTVPLLAYYQLDKYFCAVVGGDTVSTKKPDPEPLLECCRKTNITKNNSIMVGDSIADIAGASNAGMLSILVSYGYRTQSIEELAADYVIDNLSDIINIFDDSTTSTL